MIFSNYLITTPTYNVYNRGLPRRRIRWPFSFTQHKHVSQNYSVEARTRNCECETSQPHDRPPSENEDGAGQCVRRCIKNSRCKDFFRMAIEKKLTFFIYLCKLCSFARGITILFGWYHRQKSLCPDSARPRRGNALEVTVGCSVTCSFRRTITPPYHAMRAVVYELPLWGSVLRACPAPFDSCMPTIAEAAANDVQLMCIIVRRKVFSERGKTVKVI